MPVVPSPLRIALVCLHTSPGSEPGSGDAGGMNVVVRHQAEALATAGHTVEILTRRFSAELPDFVSLSPGVTLRFLTAGPARLMPKGRHEDFVEDFRASMAEHGPYDIFHSHHWFSGMAALPLARQQGAPHVQSFHSIAADESTPLSEGERPESPGRMKGEAWLAQESDAVIAISAAEAATVVFRLGGSVEHVDIVLPGVDGEMFRPSAAGTDVSFNATPPPGYAIVAARLQPLKGLDLAIEAIAAVPQSVRPELIIAGDASSDFDGYVDELKALAAKRGIPAGVRFIGPQSRLMLAELLRNARVVLVPSHSETFGLVALEGAASGVPVVVASAGGLREAVVDGATGVVLDSRDPEVWGEAITTILTDTELATRLSLAARERAVNLDWIRSAEGLLAVYTDLLRPGAAGWRQELASA